MAKNSTNKPDSNSAQNQNRAEPLAASAWSEWKRRWRDPITLFTFLLVIVGALQSYTLWVTDGTLKQTLVVGQRAFVFPTLGTLYISPNADKDPQMVNFPFVLTNNGNTATKNLKIAIKCAPSVEDLADPWIIFIRDKVAYEPAVIGPKGTISIGCAFPFSQLEEISAGKLFGFIMMEVTYEDRLEPVTPRVTQIAGRLSQVSITRPQELNGVKVPAQTVMLIQNRGKHNCADDECPK